MHEPNPPLQNIDLRIVGSEADGVLGERDRLLYRASVDLAVGDMGVCERPVAIKGDYRLVFGNGLRVLALPAQHLTFAVMRKRAARCRRQGSSGQIFRA